MTQNERKDHDRSTSRDESRSSAAEDARVVAALDEYLAAIEKGRRPPRAEFLARHADIAESLAACLDGLDLIHGAAPELERSGAALRGADETPLAAMRDALPLGDFQLLREIGRGGMGVVYEARQLSLGRRVAVKVLPLAAALDPSRLARFRHEAQAAAQLRHDHIVAIHAVGCERGVHFHAMDYVDGCSLASIVREMRGTEAENADDPESVASSTIAQSLAGEATLGKSLATHHTSRFFQSVARLGIQAADALEHAHQLGIVHRDVKPANLLVDATARLWVADFGLARLANDPGLTMTGDLVGTLRYMSPEQALGRPTTVDHRTDVYSLGVTLYELLTLEPAVAGADRQEVLHRLWSEEPRPIRRLNPAVPPDLETIVLKAMNKAAEGRYASAADLAADLRRFLDGRPIAARRPSAWDRTLKWTRRHRALVAAAFATLAVAVTALSIGLIFVWNARRDAESAYQSESRQRMLAQQALYAAHINLAQQEADAGRPRRVLELLQAHLPSLGEPDPRTFEWHYLWNECQRGLTAELRGGEKIITSLAFTGAEGTLVSASTDGAVRLWDVSRRRELRTLATGTAAMSVDCSNDGALAAGINERGDLTIWGLKTGVRHGRIAALPSGQVAFIPGDHRLAYPSADNAVSIVDADTLSELARFESTQRQPTCLGVSPDGAQLAIGFESGALAIWNPATDERRLLPAALPHQVTRLAWSADGSYLAAGCGDGSVRLWSADSLEERYTWHLHDGNVLAVQFSPAANYLATAGADGIVMLWDAETGRQLVESKAHAGPLYSLAFSPDGRTIASGAADGAIKLWNVFPARTIASLHAHADAVWSVAISADGRTAASAGRGDSHVRLWDVQTGKPIGSLALGDKEARSVAYSRDGRWLLAGAADGLVQVWHAKTHETKASFTTGAGGVKAIACDDSGELAACGTDGGSVLLWNLHEKRLLSTFETGAAVRRLTFVPGRRWLASLGNGGMLNVWDLSSDRRVYSLPLPLTEGWSLAASPDGRYLACGGTTDALLIDVETGEILTQLKGHTRSIYAQAFSPDGRTLATAGMDRTIKLWDPANGHLRMTIKSGVGFVHSLAFSPDGNLLITGRHDGAISFWRASPADASDQATAQPGEAYEPPIPDNSRLCNNLAWELANAPHPTYRDVPRALVLARRAVELEPVDGIHWQTLGVVQYRAGDLPAARESLERSCEMRDGGDACDFIFRAMVAARQGDAPAARDLLEQARQKMDRKNPADRELLRFFAEAESALPHNE